MSIMNKDYIVTMPNGERWSVKVSDIAEHRARYYAMRYGGNVRQSYQEDTKPLFEGDNDAVEYWAQNHMKWKDVSDKATLVSTVKCGYQAGWTSGHSEIK